MTQIVSDTLQPEMLAKLFSVLKGWADGMDPFRYEMFARRLVAAEYGRADAIDWALSWYKDILEEERNVENDRQCLANEEAERRALVRAEFEAGRCSNPNYQAFLDTLEHPELMQNHAPYMCWIASLLGKLERTPGVKKLTAPERNSLWHQIIKNERDQNLADRLKIINT